MTVLDKTCKIHSACYLLRSTSGDWPVLWQIGIMLGLICNALALHGVAGVPILLVISMENDKSSLGRVGHFAFNWKAKSKYQLQEMLVNINPFNFFREKYSFYTYRYILYSLIPVLYALFQGGPFHDVLHSILGAYTCYRPDVGYVSYLLELGY